MSIPSKAELERMFDTETAEDVRFVEAVGSWPSLRILDFLYSEESATTGDIARELNMDMRDVKERLETLEEIDVVERRGDEWVTTADRIGVTLERSEGIDISHSLQEEPPSASGSPSNKKEGEGDTEKQTEDFFASVRQKVESLFR